MIYLLIIRSVGGGKYKVFSHKGKSLSKKLSKAEAEKRLHQIEYFKHKKKKRKKKRKK